ncbi:hypothetical protein OXX69_002526 [Metschnikowia pulcherrima]
MGAKLERKNHLQKDSDVTAVESLVAGSVSGAVARAVTAPLDTIKIRLQLSSMREDGLKGTGLVKELLRNEGIRALWKGNIPAEGLYILYGASQFTSFAMINKWFSHFQDQNHFSVSQSTQSLLVGGATGFISTFVTYPFDLLRTRLVAHESRNLLSIKDTCKSIHALDGLKGFFFGVHPTLLSVVMSSGLFFWSYSLARDAAEEINKRSHGKLWGVEAMCGFVAGVTAKAITFPLDTIRKRMQVLRGGRASQMLIDHWRSYGLANFYRGFGVSVIKTAPTSAISMAIYEYSISSMRAMKGSADSRL